MFGVRSKPVYLSIAIAICFVPPHYSDRESDSQKVRESDSLTVRQSDSLTV